jgi:RNA polymerase sigma-70 factor (ECF subfamily)
MEVPSFNVLCPKYRTDILALAKRYTGSPDQAEDLVQDTYVRAFRHWDNFKQETDDIERDVKVWLKKILTNVFYTSWQRDQKRNNAMDEYATELDEVSDEPSEEVERLQRVMNKLRPMYKEVLQLHYIEGLSYQQIADQLNIKFVQVQKRLYRARQYIKMFYEHMGVSVPGAVVDTAPIKAPKRVEPEPDSVDSVVRRDDTKTFASGESIPNAETTR